MTCACGYANGIKSGDGDTQVLDFLVARYGEFVLLKPRLSWHTVALKGLPPTVLLVGAVVILLDLCTAPRRQAGGEQANLTAAEGARLGGTFARSLGYVTPDH